MSLLKVLYGLQCVYPRDRGLFDAYPNDAQTSIMFIANTQLSVFQKSSISDRVRYIRLWPWSPTVAPTTPGAPCTDNIRTTLRAPRACSPRGRTSVPRDAGIW